jgi:hypothetical protein
MSNIKIHKIAVIAIISSLLSYASHLLSLKLDDKYWKTFLEISIILTIIGLFLGLIIAGRLTLTKNQKVPSIIVAFLAIILSIYTLHDIYKNNVTYMSQETICVCNLADLHKSMLTYANEHKEQCPTADKWCDILISANLSPKTFKCPSDKIGPSNYALNPNATLYSPSDVVVIYETTPGWNQYGGTELLTYKNHKRKGKEGANILFNNGSVQFIKKKDFGTLNWGTPQEPNKIQNIK